MSVSVRAGVRAGARACVPVTGLVSLILPSVAGAPRSSFSRAMTRFFFVVFFFFFFPIVMKLFNLSKAPLASP